MSDLEPITQEETAWANGDLEPITRKEQYLNRLTGEEQAIPETPVTRTEQYLAKLCGMETEIPSSPITREEAYLAYLNGEDVALPEPITRLEQFMAFAAGESETKPTPLTREELYWDKYQGGAVLKDFPGLPASIVTVTDALAKPLDSLKVAITPVQAGSRDPSPENIRPIRGFDACEVSICSKNFYSNEGVTAMSGCRFVASGNDGLSVIQNGINSYPGTKQLLSNYNLTLGKTYAMSAYATVNRGIARIAIRNATNQVIVSTGNHEYSRQLIFKFKLTSNMNFITFFCNYGQSSPYGNVMYSDIKFFEVKEEYPITFTDGTDPLTVYGGTLDVVNGALTVTKANIASYDGETLPGVWISDRDVYVEGTTPTTGAQVVYDLDTPITYQLTPTEVQMLLGTNNIWADTGDILEGKYWGKKSSATRAMLNTLRDGGELTEITPEEQEETEENADER